jgi:rhodanese-related sulfurtransferase
VASFLKHKGIKETAALLGGLDAWKAAGLRLEKGSGARKQ